MEKPSIPDRSEELLTPILREGRGAEFCLFSNADGKSWLMPVRHMRLAMSIYQPGGVRGKLLKRFLPGLYTLKAVKRALRISQRRYELSPELSARLSVLFQVEDFEFALFCGAPSASQKITIQIHRGKEILGYCKLSEWENVRRLFEHEKTVLDGLHDAGVSQIPRCLYAGPCSGDTWMFVQTTEKKKGFKSPRRLCESHWNFLKDLHEKTVAVIRFEESDFAGSLAYLSSCLPNFREDDIPFVRKAIIAVTDHFGKQDGVAFSLSHRDFTPWNMFVEKGRLFVFDFEFAARSYPPYLDAFHFLTQVALLEKRLDAEQIYRCYERIGPAIRAYVPNSDLYYLCYLLDILSHYFKLYDGRFPWQDRSYVAWISLLKNILHRIEL